MQKHWSIQKREKKSYPLIGEVTTQMRFIVLGDKDRFLKHKHAWKAWRTLKGFGCTVYPVAEGLTRLDGVKVYPDMAALTDQVDVVVPCLKTEGLTSLIKQSKAAGVKIIWFQEGNWNEELQAQCDEAGITAVRGCILKHKIYATPFCYFHPCYWHGLRSPKVPDKRR